MDYRYSHVGKGADYDNALSVDALSIYMTEIESEILSMILPRLFSAKIPRYLDFACGTGRITQLIENLAEESYALDISRSMIDQARQKCSNTTFIVADFTAQDIDIDLVDLVTAFRFFGNAQDELRISALHAINGVMREGAYLILNNHRNPWAMQNILYRLSGGEPSMVDLSWVKIKRMLAVTGFRAERIFGIGWWIFRHGLNRAEVLNSRGAKVLEPMSRFPLLGPICPGAVILSRKMHLAAA